MKCPACGKPIILPTRTEFNVENYGGSVLSVTKCCGKIVRVSRVISFHATTYTGDQTEDDWGVKGK